MKAKHHILFFMALAHFIHHIQMYTFPALIILIVEDIKLSYFEIGILGTLPVLIMALSSPIIGYYGKYPKLGVTFVIGGIFVFAFSSLVISLSTTFLWLFVGNLLLGIGAMTYHPVGLGMIANSFDTNERGKAMAVNHAMGVIGNAVSPFITLGVAIFILRDWRLTYLMIGVVTLVIGIFMLGWLLYRRLLTQYAFLMKRFETHPEKISVPATSVQLNGADTVKKQVLTKKWILVTLGILLVISSLRGGIYRSLSYFTVTLLRDFYDVGRFEAGLWTSFILAAGAASDIYGAVISDKEGAMGRFKIVFYSALGTAISLLLIMLLTAQSSAVWLVVIGFSLFAVTFYLAGGTLQALMSDIVSKDQRTMFYSVVFSLGLVVSSVAPTIFGGLLDIFLTPLAPLSFLLLLTVLSFVFLGVFWQRLKIIEKYESFEL